LERHRRGISDLLFLLVDDAPFEDHLGFLTPDLSQGGRRRDLHILGRVVLERIDKRRDRARVAQTP
jgi:hypothetical protein